MAIWGSWDPFELQCVGPGACLNCSVGVPGPLELQYGGPGTL